MTTEYRREQLFGHWYNTSTDENGIQTSESAELAADGSFEITFLTFNEKGEVSEKIVELGDWGLVGDIHFTITKNEVIAQEIYGADLADSENYHAYRVLQLNNKVFEYQHLVSNEVFNLRRVADTIGHS